MFFEFNPRLESVVAKGATGPRCEANGFVGGGVKGNGPIIEPLNPA